MDSSSGSRSQESQNLVSRAFLVANLAEAIHREVVALLEARVTSDSGQTAVQDSSTSAPNAFVIAVPNQQNRLSEQKMTTEASPSQDSRNTFKQKRGNVWKELSILCRIQYYMHLHLRLAWLAVMGDVSYWQEAMALLDHSDDKFPARMWIFAGLCFCN